MVSRLPRSIGKSIDASSAFSEVEPSRQSMQQDRETQHMGEDKLPISLDSPDRHDSDGPGAAHLHAACASTACEAAGTVQDHQHVENLDARQDSALKRLGSPAGIRNPPKPVVQPAVAPLQDPNSSNPLIVQGQDQDGISSAENSHSLTLDVKDSNRKKNKRKMSKVVEPQERVEHLGASDDVQIIAEAGCVNRVNLGCSHDQPTEIDPVGAVCVHLTGYSSSTAKSAHRNILQRLNMSVVDDADDLIGLRKVTHVVAPPGVRNRKTVAALATQRWLLRDSWIEACALAQVMVAEAEHGVRRSAATLAGTSFFFEASYRKQHENSIHKVSSLSKLIKFCGGIVVHMGRSDYLLVGDEHDAAGAVGARSLTLDAFLSLAIGEGADQGKSDVERRQSPIDSMHSPQAVGLPQSADKSSPTLREFFCNSASAEPTGRTIAVARTKEPEQPIPTQSTKRKKVGWSGEECERLAALMRQHSGLQPPQLRFEKIAQDLGTGRTAEAIRKKTQKDRVKRTRVADMADAAESDRSEAAFRSSEEGSSGQWRFEKHELIGKQIQHRLLGHKKHVGGEPDQYRLHETSIFILPLIFFDSHSIRRVIYRSRYITRDNKQTMRTVAQEIACSVEELVEVNNLRKCFQNRNGTGVLTADSALRVQTYLLQPEVEILQARIFGASVSDNCLMLVVDSSGVFAVPETTVREKISAVLEEADIEAAFDEGIDDWQRDQDISDSSDESRLSTGSSASAATTESDASGDGGVSPTTSVEESYADEEVSGWSAILND